MEIGHRFRYYVRSLPPKPSRLPAHGSTHLSGSQRTARTYVEGGLEKTDIAARVAT
jgi:hypothetical protein